MQAHNAPKMALPCRDLQVSRPQAKSLGFRSGQSATNVKMSTLVVTSRQVPLSGTLRLGNDLEVVREVPYVPETKLFAM